MAQGGAGSGLGGMLATGMALGAGSAVGHMAVQGLMGGRGGGHGDQVQGDGQQAPVQQ